MGKIFYIMGKSASGKDRIYSLLAAHKELNLKTLILYTTRPIRVGEQDGKNYYFVDDGKLEEFRKNGNLIEERAYHTVYGIWTYFTADDEIDENMLKEFLNDRLTKYMVPTVFMQIDEMPQTPNGKIDIRVIINDCF